MPPELHQLVFTANQENHDAALTPQQCADLTDELKQAEYRRAYQQQLDRQVCPGCGEP